MKTNNGNNGKNTIGRKVIRFVKSLYNHITKGMPKCSQFEIDSRYLICQECESYYNNQCLECGCSVNRNKELMNKLAWKDQSCPLHKW